MVLIPDVNTEKLQYLAHKNYDLDLQGALRRATGLKLDTNGICKRLFGKEKNQCLSELTQILSNRALLLDGASGGNASTPDSVALSITGDIDIRVEYIANTVPSGNQTLLSKWLPTTQQSYEFRYGGFATLDATVSSTGANGLGITPLLPPVGNRKASRMTVDVDNGAAGRVFTIYTAPSLDGPWTIFNQATQAGAITIFDSTTAVILGTISGGTEAFNGRITRAEIRNGINGTVVANPDFRAKAPGTTSFTDAAGNLWTLNGSAKVV